MNREIKFRGKRLDNGEWVQGTPVWSVNKRCYMIVWAEEYEQTDTLHEIEYAEVDSTTVGQYTGIQDKDGRDVYEEDIVAIDFKESKINFPVSYKKVCFVITDDDDCIYDLYNEKRENITVIGNIHDNPELLENE